SIVWACAQPREVIKRINTPKWTLCILNLLPPPEINTTFVNPSVKVPIFYVCGNPIGTPLIDVFKELQPGVYYKTHRLVKLRRIIRDFPIRKPHLFDIFFSLFKSYFGFFFIFSASQSYDV